MLVISLVLYHIIFIRAMRIYAVIYYTLYNILLDNKELIYIITLIILYIISCILLYLSPSP